MTMETMEKTTLERDIDKIKDLIENADTTLLSYKESDFDSKEAKTKLVELLNDGVKRENGVPFLKEFLHSLEWKNVKMEKLEDVSKDKIKDVLSENRKNPFPKHKGYTKVWTKLTPKQQEEMEANIKIASDGGIEIPKMKEKYSILLPKVSLWKKMKGILVDWKNKYNEYDFFADKGQKEIEKEAGIQGKSLDSLKSAKLFINSFPWETTSEKIRNCVQLFELENVPKYTTYNNLSKEHEEKYKNIHVVTIGTEWGTVGVGRTPVVIMRDENNLHNAEISFFESRPAAVIVSEHLDGYWKLHWF